MPRVAVVAPSVAG